MPFQPFKAPNKWDGPGANPATPAFGANGKPFLGALTLNVLQEMFGNSTSQKWLELNLPLAISPTLGETWVVDALNLSVVLKYTSIGHYIWKEQFEKFEKKHIQMEKRITELEHRKANLEQARLNMEAVEKERETKGEKTALLEASVEVEKIKGEVSALQGEIANIKAEIIELEKEQFEFQLGPATEAIFQGSPFTIVGELFHATELIWTETLEPRRTAIGKLSWETGFSVKVNGEFYELLEQRVSLPIPVTLLPGETMSLRLKLYGPFPPAVPEEQNKFQEVGNEAANIGLFGLPFIPGINYEQQ